MTTLVFLLLFLQISSNTRAQDEETLLFVNPTDHEDILTKIVEAIRQGSLKFAEDQIVQLGDAAPIAQIVHDVYAKSEQNMELLINLTASLSDLALSNLILTALQEELNRYNHNNIGNLIYLAKAFKPEVIKEQSFSYTKPNPNLSELLHEINDIASAFLVRVMKSEASYVDNEDVKSLSAALADLPTVSSMAMQSLVRDCFFEVDQNKLLEGIYSHSNTWQALQGLYQFFWLLDKAGPLKGNIVLKHASLLSETMNRKDYMHIDPVVRYSIDKVVERIPACARNLFFQSSFCVWSKHQNSFLISSDQVNDAGRRSVFLAPPLENGTIPSGADWRVNRTGGDRLNFSSVAFPNENLFAAGNKSDSGHRQIFSWIPAGDQGDQGAWNMELDGDTCHLKNLQFEEFLISSDARYGSSEDKYVFLAKRDDPTANRSAFVWQITSCASHSALDK